MASNFIPSFHLIPSERKLNSEWCKKAIDYYWHNSNVKSLLWNKKIKRIEQYTSGDIDMKPFMDMYKSIKKKAIERFNNEGLNVFDEDINIDEIIFQPLPLIQNKLNSAITLIQKIPIEINCTANDALAIKKRKEDIDFLKNKESIEFELQDIADQLMLDKVDLGATKNSSTKFSEIPFGLDLNNSEQEKIFANLIYALSVETAIEKSLQHFSDFKNVSQVRLLETKDQYKWAVSAHNVFINSITGLPDVDYVHPADVWSAESSLPDYSDKEARFWEHRMTVSDLFNRFSDEIDDEEDLNVLINSFCDSNKLQHIDSRNYNTAKVTLVYCEIRSVDYVGVYSNPKSKIRVSSFTDNEERQTSKIWGENTYCFWWLKNTRHFFAIDKLGFAHRKKGMESYQNFSINIYKSNEKSAVELSIGENIKAQIADIKMNFEVVMARANGIYIDIRGIRNAALALKENDTNIEQKLINLALERNIMIADTEGFEGKNDGQFKPVMPIEGGIKNIVSYLQVIQSCDQKIDQFIGTNGSLTGMSANPDALIGVEKLRINASINSLYYVTVAIDSQLNKLFNVAANCIQESIKAGGDAKKALINYIGAEDVDLIEGLNQTPLHNLSLKITFGQREEERQNYQNKLNLLISKGAISLTEEYILSSITNPKQRFAYLAMVEEGWKKEQEKIRQQEFERGQALQQQRNEGLIAAENAATEGGIKKIYASGEVQAKIATLLTNLGLQEKEFEFVGKKALQQDRGQDQLKKVLAAQEAKSNYKMQEPLPLA